MTAAQLHLIPPPAKLEQGNGAFPLREGLSIVVSHRAEQGEWVAARAVQAALARQGLAVPIQPQRRCARTTDTIVLAVRGRDEDVFPALQPSGETLDDREAYTLTIDEHGVVVWGASPRGLARGAQTLCQAVAQAEGGVPALRIVDTPAFHWRGVMLDVSRGKSPTLETLYGVVDLIASFKLNMLQLYVEHTFSFRSHPKIGVGWGPLTPEEIVALDAYCRERYVELVPCLQSFGHLRRALELPEYRHLAESDAYWSVAPALEESYAFLNDLYGDFLACFSSAYINVCSDETYDLGTGRSKEIAEREGRGRLYLRHIQRLHELAAAHGRTIMVWDDMFLHYPELLAEVPRDTILLNWWYEGMETYRQVDVVHDAGLPQIVCPGTSSWSNLFPRLANARTNIRSMAADGKRVGALGVMTTDWGDNGHPNLLGTSWYGYAYGGAESWAPGIVESGDFERVFARLLFGPGTDEQALGAIHDLDEACALPGLRLPSGSRLVPMFFGDPLNMPPLSLTPEQIEFLIEMLRAHGGEVSDTMLQQAAEEYGRPVPAETLTRLRELASDALARLDGLHGATPQAALTLDEFRLAARQIRHAADKTIAGQAAMAAPEGEVQPDLHEELLRLKRELHDLRCEYERLWLARNKPEGIWLTLDGFDVAAQVLDRWIARVQPHYGWGQ